MQQATAEVIRHPEDLHLPPEAVEVFRHLSKEGSAIFSQEIVQAVIDSQRKGNLRPLEELIEAWYRTLLLRQDPSYAKNKTSARRSRPRKGQTIEQIRERLGV